MASIWTALSASVRGALHEQKGQMNQDAVRAKKTAGAFGALFLAVADGHGSPRSFRSDRGSALAVECALRLLQDFDRRHGRNAPLSQLRRLMHKKWPRALLTAWKRAVRADIRAHPFSFLDFAAFPEPPPVIKPGIELPPNAYLAYGATLIMVAVTPRYILYAQLGDGDILAVNADGRVSRPLRRDHQFYANETVSLCTHHALNEFQVRIEPNRAGGPALIMLSTDGYANCFGADEGFFQVGADFLTYLRKHGVDFIRGTLEEWLRESSHAGSGDDITVALAIRLAALRPSQHSAEPSPPSIS
jgi:serine/threonine protein phosphatase PrpC